MNQSYFIKLLILVLLLIVASTPHASSLQLNVLEKTINQQVRENKTFYGLASYYNGINYYLLDTDEFRRIDEDTEVKLDEGQWLLAAGRFNVLVVGSPGFVFKIHENNLKVLQLPNNNQAEIKLTDKSQLRSINPLFDQVRYAHLWSPLAWLAKAVESSLVFLHQYISNWGWVIVVFSVLLKLLLIPAGLMTVKFQRKVSQVKTALEPKLAHIKKTYKGEQAHNHIMSAHKELGVSPFYTLKPILASFIQVPILIAVFNALGEMPMLLGQSFLWIGDLAYPDSVAQLSSAMPLFGCDISLLPVLMTVVTLFSTIIFRNKFASATEIKSQKTKLYLMAFAFFVLFYPFPAAMVLYWALANILQTIQQQLIKI
jgi:YidC/Oxa1 family membrane protein insertase